MSDLQHFNSSFSKHNRPLFILTTLPSNGAEEWLFSLVKDQLAGCVTKIPGAVSSFIWEDKFVTEHESIWLIKSTSNNLSALTSTIRNHHPYDTPEIAVIDIAALSNNYWNWLQAVTSNSQHLT
jgi:periplasmic divalent cation tolerance protein